MKGPATAPKIVSLLPAATEIVGALGLMEHLVGVSHECDHPPEALARPQVTHCEIHGGARPSGGIDRWVTETLDRTGTLYTMDEPLLRRLQPDLILTQRLCDVCAVGYDSVQAFALTLPGPPRVVNLEPATLPDIFDDIRRVADAAGVPERAEGVVAELAARVEAVRARAAGARRRPRCVVLEWIDPPFASGHWNPELVEIAGGREPLGAKGRPSRRVSWDDVRRADPEVLVVACCGFDLERTRRDLPLLRERTGWAELPAVRQG
ncbi:MAG TPA: ABC transporter substrate-binding protein, partial [Vicinamibacteria bacterium]|nr:ABC transporter substrate-binding protein [Vicinamibacteria bacterium]